MRTNRRSFVKNMLLGSAALSAGNALGGIPVSPPTGVWSPTGMLPPGPVPTKRQQTWQECEVGLIYHFDISVADGKHTSGDRKRLVQGKSVSVRLDLGGCRIIKKKTK